MRSDYLEKLRFADEAEDEYVVPAITCRQFPNHLFHNARFVSNGVADKYTSPTSNPREPVHNIRKTPTRQPTLSERVTQCLRGLAASAIPDKSPPAPPLPVFDVEVEKPHNPETRLDKGKGKATELDLTASPPSLSPPLPPKLTVTTEQETENAENQKVLLAGLPFTYPQISSLLTRAKAEMPLRPVRFPILGEYKECFSGEEFVG